MENTDNKSVVCYLVVVDPTASLGAVSAELPSVGLKIKSRFDAIRTLVVAGDAKAAVVAAARRGVMSLELKAQSKHSTELAHAGKGGSGGGRDR